MLVIKLLLFICVLLLGSAFAALNSGNVHLNYYFGGMDLPFALVAVILLAIGALLGVLVTGIKILRLKRDNFRMRLQLKAVSKESTEPETNSLRGQ